MRHEKCVSFFSTNDLREITTLESVVSLDNVQSEASSHEDTSSTSLQETTELLDGESPYPFEGPEKRLEVVFKPHFLECHPRGFREYSTYTWSTLLSHAKCTILSVLSSSEWDAFILSESSLFVGKKSIMLKTCGTTTLLEVIPPLLCLANELETEVEFVCFSHKNFNFADLQLFPHKAFDQEVEYLNHFFSGEAFVLGPITGDHFFMYVADFTSRIVPDEEKDQTLEILMSDLDSNVMSKFFKPYTADKKSFIDNISTLVPGMEVDEHLFDPCGYSMNGLIGDAFVTVHVTPERQHNYVSFETNFKANSYDDMIRRVFDYFKPGRATVTVFADQGCITTSKRLKIRNFTLNSVSSYEFAEDYDCTLCNYSCLSSPE